MTVRTKCPPWRFYHDLALRDRQKTLPWAGHLIFGSVLFFFFSYSSCSVVRHNKVRNTNIHSDWAEHDCHRIFSRLPSKALTRTTQRMTSKLLNHQKSQIVQISPSVRKTRFPWPLNRRACSQNNSVVLFLLPCKILSSIFQREFNIMEQLFHKGRMFSRGFELK